MSALLQNTGLNGSSRSKMKTVELQDGTTTTVDFDFPTAGAAIEGYVTFNGEPLQQGWISCSSGDDSSGRESSSAQLQERGYYKLEGLTPGEAAVMYSVFADGQQLSRRATVDVTDGQVSRHDVDLGGGGRVRGTVRGIPQGWNASVLIASGDASPDVMFGGDPAARERFVACCLVATSIPAPDGTFSTAGIEPGEYTVFVTAADPQSTGDPETPRANMRHATGRITITESQDATINLQLD